MSKKSKQEKRMEKVKKWLEDHPRAEKPSEPMSSGIYGRMMDLMFKEAAESNLSVGVVHRLIKSQLDGCNTCPYGKIDTVRMNCCMDNFISNLKIEQEEEQKQDNE